MSLIQVKASGVIDPIAMTARRTQTATSIGAGRELAERSLAEALEGRQEAEEWLWGPAGPEAIPRPNEGQIGDGWPWLKPWLCHPGG